MTDRRIALLLLLGACSEQPTLTSLPEVCGAPGPVRVLELEPDQALLYPPWRIGERFFYDVGVPSPTEASAPYTPFLERARWTTGPCGESPLRVPDELEPFELDHWPGLALACDPSKRSIVSLAPDGPLAPHVVFEDIDCTPSWTAHGAVDHEGIGEHGAALWLHPYPGDPRSQTSEPVLLSVPVRNDDDRARYQVVGDQIFAINTDDELVRIDLPGGEVTVEQAGVAEFLASSDGRYYAWVTIEDGERGIYNIILTDRETGVGFGLGRVGWLDGPLHVLPWAERGLLPVQFSGDQRIYRLPGLSFVDVPPGHSIINMDVFPFGVVNPLPDGRLLVRDVRSGALRYLDSTTGEVTSMFLQPAQVLAQAAAGALLLQSLPCCTNARADDESPLWFVPPDGPPELLSERATLFTHAPNERQIFTLRDIDDRRNATLVLIQRDGSGELALDDHVFAGYFNRSSEPDLVHYSVRDGERSGVWLARLPR